MNVPPIIPADRFHLGAVTLRLVTLADCNERYVAWLNDPQVNRYLETRWDEQTLTSVRGFVAAQIAANDSWLFAITVAGAHLGNLKIGPVQPRHRYADISYFLGERSAWGQGHATNAIRIAVQIAFAILDLHRVQAGLYAGNVGSGKALEKSGFSLEGRFAAQLRGPDGWEDHLWYGLVREHWQSSDELRHERLT
jgi:[ribosomal protein S5]-alanine N-acetyltransferase